MQSIKNKILEIFKIDDGVSLMSAAFVVRNNKPMSNKR